MMSVWWKGHVLLTVPATIHSIHLFIGHIWQLQVNDILIIWWDGFVVRLWWIIVFGSFLWVSVYLGVVVGRDWILWVGMEDNGGGCYGGIEIIGDLWCGVGLFFIVKLSDVLIAIFNVGSLVDVINGSTSCFG